MVIKNRRFSGGYRFANFDGIPGKKLFQNGLPQKVIIPLKQGFGKEVPSIVKKGESVKAGQIIGIDDESISSPVHSSVNGFVEEIKKISYFGKEINAVIITSDETANEKKGEVIKSDWKALSSEKIEERLYLSGVTSLDRSGIPTRFKSSIILPKDVEHVIIYCVGSEVYNLAFSVLFDESRFKCFINGLGIIKKIMPKTRVHVALNRYQKRLIKKLNDMVSDFKWINIYPLEPKYPQERDEVLISTVLKKRYPYGYLAAHIGVIVLSFQTLMHLYEAVVYERPLIERIITLSGPGFSENVNLRVRVGTQINDIIQGRVISDGELRFIRNSPMTGEWISDLTLPVDRTMSSIVSLLEKKSGEILGFAKPGFVKDSYSRTFVSSFINFRKTANTNIHGEERPCIFCNFCEEVCPVNIIPHLLYRNVKNDVIDETLVSFRIFNCIDCNLCTYVCPSKIQVANFIKEGKEKLIDIGLDQSDFIRANFKLRSTGKFTEKDIAN